MWSRPSGQFKMPKSMTGTGSGGLDHSQSQNRSIQIHDYHLDGDLHNLIMNLVNNLGMFHG